MKKELKKKKKKISVKKRLYLKKKKLLKIQSRLKRKVFRKRKKKHTFIYILKLKISTNNIFMTFTTKDGKTIYKLSAGNLGFKGSRRKNLDTMKTMTKFFISKLQNAKNIKFIKIIVKDFHEDQLVRFGFFHRSNFMKLRKRVKIIRFLPVQAHNGTRAKKKRRI